jgi:hypothetical protein
MSGSQECRPTCRSMLRELMANTKTGTNSFTTTYSIDPELYKEFQRITAKRHNRTPRQQVRQLIAEYVEREKAAA